ncbi:hypothetical protein COU00_00825, partial [Candidatus Falkowbacteria bacterium CG10_big_fil_rev_8_21_14_0_10_43_11]
LFCGVARFPSDGGAGFLIGGFAQKMFEHQSKNTATRFASRQARSSLVVYIPRLTQNYDQIIIKRIECPEP